MLEYVGQTRPQPHVTSLQPNTSVYIAGTHTSTLVVGI